MFCEKDFSTGGRQERRQLLARSGAFSLLKFEVRRALSELGLEEPTPPQEKAIPEILKGKNVLLIAPTGSGKTEAALLPILHLMTRRRNRNGISVIYATPLRALNRDLLKRMSEWSERLDFTVEIRHGDTPRKQRVRQASKPPDLLVTTPETLQAILPGRRMRQHLRHVRWAVIDEVHELAGDRRGAQLTVGLERLRQVTGKAFQRIGLSATIGNPEEIAAFLAGTEQEVSVVKVDPPKEAVYHVEYPRPSDEDQELALRLHTAPEAAARMRRLSQLVDGASSALVFVNSRPNAEMIGYRFSGLRKDVAVHHGSLPKEERVTVEEGFKSGKLKALVCTSTLELGIDIGTVDKVMQYMSPRQVSALIQRVGRSGHRLDRASQGVIIAVNTDDIFESVAAVRRAISGKLERTRIHENALDVLAHQVAGLLLDGEEGITEEQALKIIRRAYPYRNLEESSFKEVVDFLAKLGKLRRQDGRLIRVRATRLYYYENLSMIPDERRYQVIDEITQQPVGILGEEFVTLRARVGLHFIIKGRVWRIEAITDDGIVHVYPVEDPTAAVPGWVGPMLPVPYELAQEVGRLRERVAGTTSTGELPYETVAKEWSCDLSGVERVYGEIADHVKMGAAVPTHNQILLEAIDRYLIVHTCLGEVANNTLAEVMEELLLWEGLVRRWWADGYRILLELSLEAEQINLEELAEKLLHISPEALERGLRVIIHRHQPFAYYLKFVAERFGALKRGQFVYADSAKEMVMRFRHTPIYKEAVREALQDHLDLDTVRKLYSDIKNGAVKVYTFKSRESSTPIAWHILNRFIDTPELMAPESVTADNIDRMRLTLTNEHVDLLCFNCGILHENTSVKFLPEFPKCANCASGLMAVLFWSSHLVQDLLRKKMQKVKLEKEEEETLSMARRSADLILSYGKKAIIALSVYGIGPQTAARILAKMHDDEKRFYEDLLESKLKFITTRKYWDRPMAT